MPIMKIVNLANLYRRKLYEIEKLKQSSSTLTGLASGLDVGLTLLGEYKRGVDGLTKSQVHEIREYFLKESMKHRSQDLETSIWYFSYALALKSLFLRKDKV